MATAQPQPASTKFAILQLLLREELKPQELAERLGVTSAAVRQHLATLSALGLVQRRRVPGGASRPPEVYRVSPAGRRAFPKRYDVLLGELLDVLIERLGRDAALDTVAAAARRFADRAELELRSAPPSERWPQLLAWLEEAFAWEAETDASDPTERRIRVHQCPFQDVSGRHPEVCGVFFAELIAALHGGVTLQHLPNDPGQACCAFVARRTDGGPMDDVAPPGPRRRSRR